MPDETRDAGGRGGIVLGAGEAVARLVAFGAALIVAHRLGPGPYGVVGVATGIMLYLTQVADQGIELVGVPYIAAARDATSPTVRATLTFRVLGALLLTALVAPVGLLLLPDPDGRVLAGYAPTLVLSAASVRWVLLGQGRPGRVVAARIAGEGTALVLVALLVRDAADLARVPLAAVVGLVVTTAMMLFAAQRAGLSLAPSLAWSEARSLFARGRPLVMFTLLGLVLFNFDLLFLRVLKGREAAGAYAAAYTFIAFASNLMVAYAHGVMPSLTRGGDGASAGADVYQTAQAHVLALSLPAAVGGAWVAAGLMALVFGASFDAGTVALTWLSLSLPFAALREVAVAAAVAGGGERALVRVNVVVVICNVLLNVVLTPRFGLLGAALATLATEVIRVALAARLAASVGYSLPSLARLVKPVVATTVMGLVLWGAGADPLWRALLVGAASYAAALAALGAIKVRRGALPELVL